MAFGTFVFSSLTFISTGDFVCYVVWRYILATVVCKAILMIELAGLRSVKEELERRWCCCALRAERASIVLGIARKQSGLLMQRRGIHIQCINELVIGQGLYVIKFCLSVSILSRANLAILGRQIFRAERIIHVTHG